MKSSPFELIIKLELRALQTVVLVLYQDILFGHSDILISFLSPISDGSTCYNEILTPAYIKSVVVL